MKYKIENIKTKLNRKITYEDIRDTLNKIRNKLDKHYMIITYMLITFTIFFVVASFIKNETNYYSSNLQARWDDILSYDDMYHARIVYSGYENYEAIIGTITKHPFILVIGKIVYIIENIFCNIDDKTDHYFNIVVFQIILNMISIFYLYKILKEQYNLKDKWCLLLLTIYNLATVSLLGIFIIDSFIISATLLIISYYYLSKQKLVMSTILGILIAGVCITNSLAFAIMAICLLKKKKDIFKVGISCILGFSALTLLLPYREILFKGFFSEVHNQVNLYVLNKDEGIVQYLKLVFYYLLTSPIFFLDMKHTQSNQLDSVKFELSASLGIIIVTIIFFIFLVYNIIKNLKNRKALAVSLVLLYNIFIHAIIGFGLLEATIYGLHFLFAEILLFAFGFKIENKVIRKIFIIFSIILIVIQIRYNLYGMLELVKWFTTWK